MSDVLNLLILFVLVFIVKMYFNDTKNQAKIKLTAIDAMPKEYVP